MRRCGFCEAELVGKRPGALYCDDKCRRAGWAERTGYRRGNGSERLTRARSPHPGGVQVSYRKAVNVAAQLVYANAWDRDREGLSEEACHRLAEDFMREALSPAQRERVRS